MHTYEVRPRKDHRGFDLIAAKLKISLKTVNEYCARLKKKLDAAKFNQLLRIAVLWRAGVTEIVVKGTRVHARRG
jgi:DNA-binding NarL/FixJ family response regulator